jgi:hypothetical protein
VIFPVVLEPVVQQETGRAYLPASGPARL